MDEGVNALFVPFNAGKKGRGRPRKYTPAQLLQEFEVYVNERMAHPLVIEETEEGFVGKSCIDKTKKKTIPQLLSIGDFCVHLGTSRNWWNELPEDFLGVKTRISNFLEQYQLKGASAGVFNANIVARLLGLADKKDISSGGEKFNIIVETREDKEMFENFKNLPG